MRRSKVLFGGVIPLFVLTSGFAGANLSLTDLIGRSVENFQSTIGANGQLYKDLLGTVINGGQIFGWFNDGTSVLGGSVIPPSELKD